jgi:hypothetical protein
LKITDLAQCVFFVTNRSQYLQTTPRFTQFAIFLLHNPDFEWTISTDKLRLTALGVIFDNVSLSKQVSFQAFNNLPGVTISNFQLPSDDPAGGIHIETDTTIPSPAGKFAGLVYRVDYTDDLRRTRY